MLPPHKVRLNKKYTTLRLTMIFKQPLNAVALRLFAMENVSTGSYGFPRCPCMSDMSAGGKTCRVRLWFCGCDSAAFYCFVERRMENPGSDDPLDQG